MGNHNVIDLFAGKRAQQRLRHLFGSFVGTYDNPAIRGGRLAFVLYAPGSAADPSLLRSLIAKVTLPGSDMVHEARITEVEHDPERGLYWLYTAPGSLPVPDTTGAMQLALRSSCGKHCFEGVPTIPSKRATEKS